jgi:hypothetical protein
MNPDDRRRAGDAARSASSLADRAAPASSGCVLGLANTSSIGFALRL